MKKTRLWGIVLVAALLLANLASCTDSSNGTTTSPNTNTPVGTVNEFEVIRQAADAYLSTGKAEVTIWSEDLHDILYLDDDPSNDPRILSVRDYANHIRGHICNASCAPWRSFFLTLTPDKLDVIYFADAETDNEQIVVYSYTGQEGGGQSTAFLNMLGFDAINLQWGYNQWQFCPDASPGSFFKASTGLGRVTRNARGQLFGFWAIGMNYKTTTEETVATKTYSLPKVENTGSDDSWEIIRAAAAAWGQKREPLTPAELAEGGSEQKHKDWETDVLPVELFNLLHDSDPSNDPFILSVQPRELYDKGHIDGAVWMPINDVCKLENLKKLPPDKKIIVVSNDGMSGNQLAGILAILGYDAQNLLFGMCGWTYDEEVAPGRFETYEDDMATFKDVLGYEICWIEVPGDTMLPPIEGYEPPPLAPVEVSEF